MKISGVRFEQGKTPLEFFSGAMRASDLLKVADVDRKNAEHPKGYQRELRRQRLAEIARYLLNEDGVFPGSIICALRAKSGWQFERKGAVNGIEFGVLDIGEKAKLWLIDGQNRLYGLEHALASMEDEDEREALANMVLPVTIATGIPRFNEMRLFFVVNDRQKAVPTDLVDHLLLESMAGGSTMSPKERARSLATDMATRLARADGGPWHKRIRLPDETPLKTYQLKLHPFVASIQEHLGKDGALAEYVGTGDNIDHAVQVVDNYWNAIRRLLPDAFAEPGDYSLQRTSGVYSLHMLLPDVLKLCEQDGSATVEKIASILDSVEMLKMADKWSTKEKEKADPLTLGTNMRLLRMLRDEMKTDLPRPRIAL